MHCLIYHRAVTSSIEAMNENGKTRRKFIAKTTLRVLWSIRCCWQFEDEERNRHNKRIVTRDRSLSFDWSVTLKLTGSECRLCERKSHMKMCVKRTKKKKKRMRTTEEDRKKMRDNNRSRWTVSVALKNDEGAKNMCFAYSIRFRLHRRDSVLTNEFVGCRRRWKRDERKKKTRSRYERFVEIRFDRRSTITSFSFFC